MASAHPAAFLAVLVACAISAAAQSNTSVAASSQVSVSIDVAATVQIVSAALSDGAPALQAAREGVAAAAAQLLQLGDSGRDQDACLGHDLLEHLQGEALLAAGLVNGSSRPALQRLVGELKHQQGDVQEALQQTQSDPACQQLDVRLNDVEANVSAALDAVLQAISSADGAAQKVAEQVNATVYEQVDSLTQNCEQLIEEGQRVVQKLSSGDVKVSSEVADALRKAAETAIAAGKDGERQIDIIASDWNKSLDTLQQQIRLLITANFDASQNTNSTQIAMEIVMSLESFLSALSFKLKTEVEYIEHFVFTYRKGLEIQTEIAFQLLNIQESNTTLKLNETVNEILQLKQEVFRNVSVLLNQMLQFSNEISKLNNTSFKNILQIIFEEAETIKICIQNENIQLTINVLLQVQTYIQNVLKDLEHMGGKNAQELINALKSLYQDIENTLNEINNITHSAENQIKKLISVLSNPMQTIIQNVLQFIKTIINSCQKVAQNIKNTETLNENLKYQLQKMIQSIVTAGNKALQYLTLLSIRIQFLVNQTITTIRQITFNEKSQNQNITQIQSQIQNSINKLVNELSGIQLTPKLLIKLSQTLQAQLNSINGIRTLHIRGLLNQIDELVGAAFLEVESIILYINNVLQMATYINITAVTQLTANVTVELDNLSHVKSNLQILEAEQIIERLTVVLQDGLNALENEPNQTALQDFRVNVQNLIAKLIIVQDVFRNIQLVLKTAVQTTFSSITILEQLQIQNLISDALQLITRIQRVLDSVTQYIAGELGNVLSTFLQSLLGRAKDTVTQLNTTLTEITTSADTEVTKIVTIIISYYSNGTLTEKQFSQITELLNLSLTAWLSNLQTIISRTFNYLISLSNNLYTQETIITSYLNILSEEGSSNIQLLWTQLEKLSDNVIQELKASIPTIKDVIDLANSFNYTSFKQFAATLSVELDVFIEAITNTRFTIIVQIVQRFLVIFQSGLNALANVPEQAEVTHLIALVKNLIDQLTNAQKLFADIELVLNTAVKTTLSNIYEALRKQYEALINVCLQLSAQVEVSLEAVTQAIGGDLGTVLTNTLQSIRSRVQDVLTQLQTYLGDLASSLDTEITRQVRIIISYYSNGTLTDQTLQQIIEDMKASFNTWICVWQYSLGDVTDTLIGIGQMLNAQEKNHRFLQQHCLWNCRHT